MNRGISKAKISKHKEAIDDFNTALVLDHTNWIALNKRALSKLKVFNVIGSITDFIKGKYLSIQNKNQPKTTSFERRGKSVPIFDD